MKLKGTIMKSLWPLITLLLVSLMQVMPGKTIIEFDIDFLFSSFYRMKLSDFLTKTLKSKPKRFKN